MLPNLRHCVKTSHIPKISVQLRHEIHNLAPVATKSVQHYELENCASIISQSKKLLVISGAGISTESGIPDYRSPSRINKYSPIKYQEFIQSAYHRRRYWARSTLGYETQMKIARPNTAHYILSKWKHNELDGHQMRLITQNVDSLHLKSSFPRSHMLELHGSLREVQCMQCKAVLSRDAFQTLLIEHNTEYFECTLALNGLNGSNAIESRPDGDIQLTDTNYDYNTFVIPPCKHCNATDAIRPSVVFFGENLDKNIANASIHWSKSADCIVVCGSTLQTQSSHRLLRYAKEVNPGIPIIIINIGETRGDNVCDFKIEYYVSDILNGVDQLWSGRTVSS